MKVYLTSYCNKGHDMETGRPVNHECVVIPPDALEAEWDGDVVEAISIIGEHGPLKPHRGVKVRDEEIE